MTEPSIVIESWPIENLIPYELNAKKHDKDQVARIAASIAKSNFHQPIVVDRDGVIIAGHGRRLAALSLGLKKVPVWHRKDLWGDAARAARLADNRVAISDIDPELLRVDIAGLQTELDGIFDLKEMEYMDADLGVMNEGAFVEDMGQVLADQKTDIDNRMASVSSPEARVRLDKAFGFKDIPAVGQRAINLLMAKAQAATGKEGAEALITFAESME